jgi:hypothetical protein
VYTGDIEVFDILLEGVYDIEGPTFTYDIGPGMARIRVRCWNHWHDPSHHDSDGTVTGQGITVRSTDDVIMVATRRAAGPGRAPTESTETPTSGILTSWMRMCILSYDKYMPSYDFI